MVWSVCPIRPPIRLFQQCFMETRDHITQTRVLEVTKSLYLLVYLTVLAAVLCYPPYYEAPRSVSRVCFVSKQVVSKLFRRNSVETGSYRWVGPFGHPRPCLGITRRARHVRRRRLAVNHATKAVNQNIQKSFWPGPQGVKRRPNAPLRSDQGGKVPVQYPSWRRDGGETQGGQDGRREDTPNGAQIHQSDQGTA